MFAEQIQKAGVWWMLPILLLAWIALSLSLERLWYWWRLARRQRRAQPLLAGLYEGPPPSPAAVRGLEATATRRDPTLQTLAVFLTNLLVDHAPLAIAEARARDRAELLAEDSRRFTGVLTFIANLAGTLGLLGTVAGVSMSFEHLAQSNPKGLALSLATAMYTTIGGIFLFLVAYLAVAVFTGLSEKLERRLTAYLVRLRERFQLDPAPTAVLAEEA